MRTISQQLADFVLDTSYEALPGELSSRLPAYILDLIASSLPAISEPSSRAVIQTVLSSGSNPVSTIFGRGRVVSAQDAALANGTIAHALELDDDHRFGTVHPGAVMIPAALACAEASLCDGKTFLRAIALGYEVTCRAGETFLGRQYFAGFHPTSTCGVFGAAVASGIILGLNFEQMVNALGIAGTQAFGLGEWRADGSWIKRLHPGRAAQSGILASHLAHEGFTGPATIFEGENGFLIAFSHDRVFDEAALIRDLGRDYRAGLTAFKPYPGCRFAHAVIDLGLDLARSEGFEIDHLERGQVRIYKTDILNYNPIPDNIVHAQFSVPYLLATALVHGEVTLNHLTDEAIKDSHVLSISKRILVLEDDEFSKDYPERYSTEVRLEFQDGRNVRGFRDIPRGDPQAPDYVADPGKFDQEVRSKFQTLLSRTQYESRIEQIFKAVEELPHAENVIRLTNLLGDPSLDLELEISE